MNYYNINPLKLPSLPLAERSHLPSCPAIYFVMQDNCILYIGQTVNLTQRWTAHHKWSQLVKMDVPIRIAWLECSDKILLTQIEAALISQFTPKLNYIPTDKANDVFIRVFLNSEMRTRFKIACAQTGVAMSEKAREMIEEWTISQETQMQKSSQSEDKEDA